MCFSNKQKIFQLILLHLVSCCTSEYAKKPESILELIPKEVYEEEQHHVPVESISEHETTESKFIRPPYFHSPIYLTNLAKTEESVYEVLKVYEQELVTRLQILQRYRIDYESSVIEALAQIGKLNDQDKWSKATVISSNPMLAYRMIRRFNKDLQEFTEHIWKSLENELWEILENAKGEIAWPSVTDMQSASKALIRLQHTHDFDLDTFTDGALRDYPIKVGITAQQSLEISQTALDLGDITAATEWFQVAHSKAVHGQYQNSAHNSIPMDELTESWEKTYKSFREIWPMAVFKTHDVFAEAKKILRKDFERLKTHRDFAHRSINFKALCRGDKLRTDAEISDLICYNNFEFHSYLKINPLRIEIHNWEPLIYQVHDFLGRKTMNEVSVNAISAINDMVESGLALDQILINNDPATFTYSWLFESANPVLESLSKKMSALMGLTDMTHHLNNYQISAYAVGNHYDPCVDCFHFQFENGSEENAQYHTKTTVHAILQEPEKGGELAFTLAGTVVKPLKGSLIIYNNIHPSTGNLDGNILHGSCPILIGQKWVATKLISYKQMG